MLTANMISRRMFMQRAGLASAGLLVAPGLLKSCKAAAVQNSAIGLQLYTLRDQLATDAKGTISRIAALGYGHVETFYDYNTAGNSGMYWGLTAARLKDLLNRHNLNCYSGHYQLNDFLTPGNGNDIALKAQLEIAHTLGQQYLIVPVPPENLWNKLTPDVFRFMAAQLNKAGEFAKSAGITIGYHNHFWEFRKLEDGRIGYDILLEETDNNLVSFEIDLFWALKSGVDVDMLFTKHPGRFPLWHVKDIDKTNTAIITGPKADKRPVTEILEEIKFAEVGTGSVDFKEIFTHAQMAGLKHFFIEQDKIYMRDAFESIKISYEYAKNNLIR